MRLIDASSTPTSTTTFELTIAEYYSNLNNVMHGGAAGVVFDMSTTFALGPLARPGFWE
jgi:acyl-coenzyme A thioesterase 13